MSLTYMKGSHRILPNGLQHSKPVRCRNSGKLCVERMAPVMHGKILILGIPPTAINCGKNCRLEYSTEFGRWKCTLLPCRWQGSKSSLTVCGGNQPKPNFSALLNFPRRPLTKNCDRSQSPGNGPLHWRNFSFAKDASAVNGKPQRTK